MQSVNIELIDMILNHTDITSERLRPMLWKDETWNMKDHGDCHFLLTKYMECYLYDKTTLQCLCWSQRNTSQLRKMGVIYDEWSTDDPLDTFKIKIENLPLILHLGEFRKRPNIKGKWVKSKETLLGHRIIPFSPSLQKGKYNCGNKMHPQGLELTEAI